MSPSQKGVGGPARPNRSGNPAVRAQQAVGRPRAARPPAAPAGRPRTRSVPVAQLPEDVEEYLPYRGVAYPQILRNDGYLWWRSVFGVVLGLSLFLLLTSVVSQAVVAMSWALTARSVPYLTYATSAAAFERPSGMLGANLGIVTAVPTAWLLMALIHRTKPGWLSSVQPRLRWRYLFACLVVAMLVFSAVIYGSTLYATPAATSAQRGFWSFVVVIVLTSPLQAAAEEVFFRGYLMQALGSLVARPWFGVVVSSVVFALLHGTQNLPLFLDRLAFGLLAAVLVWRTGGIEAGVAAHVVNNLFAFVVAGLTSSIATIHGTQSIGWLDSGVDVGGFAVFAALAYLVFRRLRLQRTVGPAWSPGPAPV
jgi:membrane protease YdiL (CAAX protease family)